MRQFTLPIIAVTLLCVIAATPQKPPIPSVTHSRLQQWEYGIYQVNEGKYVYEWLDNTQHIYAPNRQAFFEKLGIANALVKANQKYIQTSRPFPDYIVDAVVLNYLGDQGWELVESSDRVFRLKRHKIR
jgi:hypothetical protein